jgi:pimeloyl-ACP methyl ester carboxylesterase
MRAIWSRPFHLLALVSILIGSAGPSGASVPSTSAPRPGPAILHAGPAHAPQLENASPWRAAPLLISGASAYRKGEFLYQDYLYDDYGAGSAYTYPTGFGYDGNAADLVEVRLKLLDEAMAVRLTYNTMENPELVAATIALGTRARPRQLPYGANTTAPATVFVTAWGDGGAATDAASGRQQAVSVHTDLRRRQVDVRVPFSAFDPRGRSVPMAVGTGLWDSGAHRYLIPQQTADATHPGGGRSASPSAFFNVGFRYEEPWAGSTSGGPGMWHESQQASALANGDLSPFFADVDFRKLARGTTDDLSGSVDGAPTSGLMSLVFASHFVQGQGRGVNSYGCHEPCPDQVPDYPGQLQPYTAYVPDGPMPRGGWGLVLNLHESGGNDNPGTGLVEPVGDNAHAIVIRPEGRGPSQWYWNAAAADAFEAWADAARRWRLNPTRTYAFGVSMGGYGTYKLSLTYPDLFARVATVVGCVSADTSNVGPPQPSNSGPATTVIPMAASLRHIPLRAYVGAADPVCAITLQTQFRQTIDSLGYRYQWVTEPTSHEGFIGVDYRKVGDFFAGATVTRDPAHVSYVVNGAMNQRQFGVEVDHVYWLFGITWKEQTEGSLDVVSGGLGIGDPEASATQTSAGVEGSWTMLPYVQQSRDWGPATRRPAIDTLTVTARNISRLVVDRQRARLTCGARLQVRTDVPLTITLSGCRRARSFSP